VARSINNQNRKHGNKSGNSQKSPHPTSSPEAKDCQASGIPVHSPLLDEDWQDGFLVWTCMNIIMGLFPIVITAVFYFLGEYTIDWRVYFLGLLPDLLLFFFTVYANICFYIIGLNEEQINTTHRILEFFLPFLFAMFSLLVYAFLYRKVSESDIHISWITWVFVGLNMFLFIICYMHFHTIWKLLYGDSEQG